MAGTELERLEGTEQKTVAGIQQETGIGTYMYLEKVVETEQDTVAGAELKIGRDRAKDSGKDTQGRIIHVANVSIETGLPSKYEF